MNRMRELLIINVITIIADTFNLPPVVSEVFHCVEVVSVIIFSVEYVLRVWTSDLIRPDINPWKARLKYVFSPMALIDFVAIAPFYIPFSEAFEYCPHCGKRLKK